MNYPPLIGSRKTDGTYQIRSLEMNNDDSAAQSLFIKPGSWAGEVEICSSLACEASPDAMRFVRLFFLRVIQVPSRVPLYRHDSSDRYNSYQYPGAV